MFLWLRVEVTWEVFKYQGCKYQEASWRGLFPSSSGVCVGAESLNKVSGAWERREPVTSFLGWFPSQSLGMWQFPRNGFCGGRRSTDPTRTCVVSSSPTWRENRASPFLKGPDSKYFKLCRLYGLCHNYLALQLWHKSSHRWYINNRRGYVPIKLYLQNKQLARFGRWA